VIADECFDGGERSMRELIVFEALLG